MNNNYMMVHNTAKMYGNSRLGYNAVVLENVMLGYPDASVLEEIARKKIKVENHEYEGTVIGDSATIRHNRWEHYRGQQCKYSGQCVHTNQYYN